MLFLLIFFFFCIAAFSYLQTSISMSPSEKASPDHSSKSGLHSISLLYYFFTTFLNALQSTHDLLLLFVVCFCLGYTLYALLFVSLVSGVCSHITGSQYRRVWNTEFSAERPVGHTDRESVDLRHRFYSLSLFLGMWVQRTSMCCKCSAGRFRACSHN